MAARMMFIEQTVQLLRPGGYKISIPNIALFTAMTEDEVTQTLEWAQNGGKKGKSKPLPFTIGEQQPPASDFARVLATLTWTWNRTPKKLERMGKRSMDSDRAKAGNQYLAQLSGMSRPDFLEVVNNNTDAIKQTMPEFKPYWIADSKEIREKNAKNTLPETKIKLIRDAVMDISQGKIGTVTAEMLVRWKGGAIGWDKRTIDKALSEDPTLRDLDKYRVHGKSTMHPTDVDREIAYQRSLTT